MIEQCKTLALDFDGLICDSLNECILVSWNGYHNKDISDFSAEGLASVPSWFAERFRHCRNFAKHLGHFSIPLFDRNTQIDSQDDYEKVYRSLDTDLVETFVEKVNNYRNLVRQHRETEWLAHHNLFPGMKEFLLELNVPLYIVTAKDRASVLKILGNEGIKIEAERVYAEQRRKIRALETIQELEGIAKHEVVFLDDNVLNAIDLKKSGFNSYWATWGYKASGHTNLAQVNSVIGLSLEEFLASKFNILQEVV